MYIATYIIYANTLMMIINFHIFSKVESQVNTFEWEPSRQPIVSELSDECVVECDSLGEFVDERVSDSNSDFSEEVIKIEQAESPCHSSNMPLLLN